MKNKLAYEYKVIQNGGENQCDDKENCLTNTVIAQYYIRINI